MTKRTTPDPDEQATAADTEQPPTEAASSTPREPRVERWIDIQGLPGFRARVWLNYPWRIFQDLTSGDRERFRAAFARVVLEHNGWLDAEGQPYPPASESATFWEQLTNPLAKALLDSVYAEARTLANFPSPPLASTASG